MQEILNCHECAADIIARLNAFYPNASNLLVLCTLCRESARRPGCGLIPLPQKPTLPSGGISNVARVAVR